MFYLFSLSNSKFQINESVSRPRLEDEQQMDTQAHHVGPQRMQKGDNGRDGLTTLKDLRATNGPEVRNTECRGKNLKKTLTL
jgi:hypothetical protein